MTKKTSQLVLLPIHQTKEVQNASVKSIIHEAQRHQLRL